MVDLFLTWLVEQLVSPGAWLTDMSLERYEVREKKISKKVRLLLCLFPSLCFGWVPFRTDWEKRRRDDGGRIRDEGLVVMAAAAAGGVWKIRTRGKNCFFF